MRIFVVCERRKFRNQDVALESALLHLATRSFGLRSKKEKRYGTKILSELRNAAN